MMNKNEIFRKIGGILVELTEQYHYLSKNVSDLNDLELELFSANSNFLFEHAGILRKLNAADPAKADRMKNTEEAEDIMQPKIIAPETKSSSQLRTDTLAGDNEITNTPETKEQPEKNVEEEVKPGAEPIFVSSVENASDPEITTVPSPGSSASSVPSEQEYSFFEPEISETKPVVQEVVIPGKVVENVSTEGKAPEAALPRTVNDLISAQQNRKKTAGTEHAPVSDLKSVISLNDKLLFIKDLFNGYSLAYSEAIEILNRFDSMEAADDFLKTNYAGKNNWAAKLETTQKFYELLERRFH